MDQIRNFRDFLKLYNVISDTCFQRCTNIINSREITSDEGNCIDSCAQKFIFMNHRIMNVYMEVQAAIVKKRIDEYNAAQEKLPEEDKVPEEENKKNNNL